MYWLHICILGNLLFGALPFVLSGPRGGNETDHLRYFLYPSNTSVNERQQLIHGDIASVASSSFKNGQLTVFIIHTLLENSTANYIQSLKNSYLASVLYPTTNIILVDWGSLSSPSQPVPPAQEDEAYGKIVRNIEPVGERLGQFIFWLVSEGRIFPENVHIIGAGMGALVAGEAGNEFLQLNWDNPLWRITGLDPSGVFYANYTTEYEPRKLSSLDASFVDIIHTNGGQLGNYNNRADADFFPNGGVHQPNCDDVYTVGQCSHVYAIQIYAAALFKPFKACQCNPLMQKEQLQACLDPRVCPNPTYLGPYCPTTARGTFVLIAPNPP